MRPSRIDREQVETYLAAGHWSRETMVDRYGAYARDVPDRIACRDGETGFTWRRLHEVTDRIAANLIARGIPRDGRALVQIPSSARETVLRVAFKKAGVLGCFAPMQWRRRELDHTFERIDPSAVFVALDSMGADGRRTWLEEASAGQPATMLRVALAPEPPDGWSSWSDLEAPPEGGDGRGRIAERRFRFDEVSLITASSGTSSLAKLNEWPEAAQTCIGRGIAERLGVREDDVVGMFAPMSGAAGVLAWTMSGALPFASVFPPTFEARALLRLVEEERITVATTVPVVLARLAREDLGSFDLSSLRVLRVGTGAAGLEAARRIEDLTGCRVVVASGAMECPGFGHADVDEPAALRLDGSTGSPLPGCRLRIDGDDGAELPAGEIGHVRVSAPFAALGYWNDPEATRTVWSDGWYATGDVGVLDDDGRLTLLGRSKEVINRSGHKILPIEVEREIARHPDVLQCAVVAVPDAEYGEVPWAFVQARDGKALDTEGLAGVLRSGGLATYKIPARFIQLAEFPRVGGNKIDKKRLLDMAPAA